MDGEDGGVALRDAETLFKTAGFKVVTGMTKAEKRAEWGVEMFEEAFKMDEESDAVSDPGHSKEGDDDTDRRAAKRHTKSKLVSCPNTYSTPLI